MVWITARFTTRNNKIIEIVGDSYRFKEAKGRGVSKQAKYCAKWASVMPKPLR